MDEKGFQKIELVEREDVVVAKPLEAAAFRRRRKLSPRKKKFLKIGGVILFLVLIVVIYTGIKAYGVYKQAMALKAQAQITYADVKQKDIVNARVQLVKTQADIAVLENKLHGLSYMKFVPFMGGYYNDASHLIKASSYGANAGLITIDALIPYADVLGLKGGGSFTGGSAQDRIRIAVKTMGKVVPQIDKIEGQLRLAKTEMDAVDPNHYPPIGGFKKIHDQVQQIKDITDGAVAAVEQGKPLIKALPSMLGENSGKKYLVLFQNDAELRPTGGFLTYYAVFSVDQGVIKIDRSSDIYTLDDSIASHPPANSIIRKYFPSVTQSYIRDSNLSPDFVVSMQAFNKLYAKSSDKTTVDGIIAIDTHFLVNVIRILGEVDVDGFKFTANNDPACGCAQVVYVLENEISRPVNYIKTNRKGLLGDLMLATLDKALRSSPKLYWGKLFQQFVVDANEKNILFYIYNQDAQQGMEALNWAGRVRSFNGDYLYINDANFGGQKSNLFVKKTLAIDYTISSTGEIKKKITISYKNPMPYSDCSLARGGLCLNATLRNYQRVLVPNGSVLDSSLGSQVKVGTSQDLGKTVFDSFFTVNPLGIASMSYTYTLPFKVSGNILPVLIQKQPGVDSIPTTVSLNGKQVNSFDLRTDTNFKLTGF